jgi:hypothetical protein
MRLRTRSWGSVVRTKKSEVAPNAMARRNRVVPAKRAGSLTSGIAAVALV